MKGGEDKEDGRAQNHCWPVGTHHHLFPLSSSGNSCAVKKHLISTQEFLSFYGNAPPLNTVKFDDIG